MKKIRDYQKETQGSMLPKYMVAKNQSIVFHQNGYFWEGGGRTYQNC
jgi:hypothetical protein